MSILNLILFEEFLFLAGNFLQNRIVQPRMMKKIKRLLLFVLTLVLAFVLFLSLSIAADAALGGNRLKAQTNVEAPGVNGAPNVRAYVAKPQGEGPFPVVIMIHEFFGLNESIRSKANLLAEQGYYVIAPDTYRGQTTAWIPRAVYLAVNADQKNINADLDSIAAWVKTQPQADSARMGIVGFCYGGRVSLLYSLHNNELDSTVVFYGSPEVNAQTLKSLPAPVLGIFGGADASIPLEKVRALEDGLQAAGVPNQISVYDGQPHAFVTDAAGIQAGGAQAQAWQEMLDFLEENLKSAPASRRGAPIEYAAAVDWNYYARLVFEHAFGSAAHLH